MEGMGDLRRQVLERLEGALPAGVRLTREYPAGRRGALPAPGAVSVGIEGVELQEAGLGGYLGDSARGVQLGRGALVTLRFGLYVPAGGDVQQLYEQLCDALLLQGDGMGLVRVWCDAPGVSGALGEGCMVAHATLRGAVQRGDESVAVREFVVRR